MSPDVRATLRRFLRTGLLADIVPEICRDGTPAGNVPGRPAGCSLGRPLPGEELTDRGRDLRDVSFQGEVTGRR
jgi:hypothetical protein